MTEQSTIQWPNLTDEQKIDHLMPPTRKATMDLAAGEAGKAQGMSNAETGAGASWQQCAVDAIHRLAREVPYLTADCLWARGLAAPAESRALGPALKVAQKLKLIAPTEDFVLTLQPTRHRAPVRVWRSLLATPAPFDPGALVSRQAAAAR